MPKAYCVKCDREVEIKNPQKTTTENKKPVTAGTCPRCGKKVFRIGEV